MITHDDPAALRAAALAVRDLLADGQSLSAPLTRLEALLSDGDWNESLAAATRRPKPRKRRDSGV